MTPKTCMTNVIADIIGLDETFSGDKLNDAETWDRFMAEVFKRMDTVEDESVRAMLNSIDTDDFQGWIDDPQFWATINDEISRRINLVKTLLPSKNQGHC